MKTNSYLSPLPILISIFILFLSAPWFQFEQQTAADEEPLLARISYEHRNDLSVLANSVDIWEVNHEQGYVVAYLTSTEYQELISMGFTVVIDQERTSQIRNNLQLSPDQTGGVPGFPCYRTVEETYTSLEDLAASHPGLAAWIDSGDSWEKWFSGGIRGYDLHTLVLTNTSTPGPKPRLYIMAAIHAREYATAELAARFAEYLVEKYDQDADITWLLDYYEVHITPIANPDGRKIAEGGIYWRKNVNNTDGCPNPNSWGTDLNRNSSFKWGLVGSSQDACSETFRGSAPASETETQAIQDYVSGIFADLRGSTDSDPAPPVTPGIFITLHSYGDSILFPWAWSGSPAPNDQALQTLGRKFGYYSGYQVCQSGEPGCLYPSSGNSDDWAYGELGVPAYTFEIGTEFFESCSYFEEQIISEQIPTLLFALKAARLPYQNPAGPESIDLSVSSQRIAPGAGLKVSFTADDNRYHSFGWGIEPSQPIAAARYSIDAPAWKNNLQAINLQPDDGGFDSSMEDFTFDTDTSNLAIGRHTIFIESQDADGNWGVPSAVFVWISDVEFQPDIEPDTRYAKSSPFSTLIYEFQVSNAGTQNDTFEIQVFGNTWPTSLSKSSIGPLIPGESAQLIVKVAIPGTAQIGDQDLAILVASSLGNPAQFTHGLVTSTTRSPLLFIPNVTK
jgi:carboxypeptidase T